jgi:hypothetical protein
MSDSGAGEDDVGLPKATVYKLVSGKLSSSSSLQNKGQRGPVPLATFTALLSRCLMCFVSWERRDGACSAKLTRAEMLPPDMACSKEAKDVMVDCCLGESPRSGNMSPSMKGCGPYYCATCNY